MKHIRYSILIAAICCLVFSSCMKQKENRLTGTWTVIPLFTDEIDKTITWTFYDDGNLVIIHTDTLNNSFVDSAFFEIKEKFFKYYVQIDGMAQQQDGSYHIEKLNKKVLILQCDEPYARKEFTK
ncbi:MAG: hypothetical protein ABIJ16_02630 [Bacteroidota bacterium]